MMTRYGRAARHMLQYCLAQTEADRCDLLAEVLEFSRFFAPAARCATAEEWQKKDAADYVDGSKALVLFLTLDEAGRFARRNHLVANDQPMVKKVTKQELTDLALEYYEGGIISQITIYSAPPLCVSCSIQEFLGTARKAHSARMPSGAMSQPSAGGEHFLEVERIRSILDTVNNAERRKLDPAGRFENAHQLIETLLMRNQIEPAAMDEMFLFTAGFTKNFCESIVDSSISKSALQSLLRYFGLGEYLYLYKKDCRELQEELKNNPSIDRYSLRPVRASTKEPFELVKVQRGKDEDNGAYVYGLTLQGQLRRQRIIVSSALGYDVGKKYEIEGLPPLQEQNNPDGVTKAHAVQTVCEEEPEAAEKDPIIRPSKPGRQLKGTLEEQKARQDFILGYFKRTDGINLTAAVAKYKVLVEDPDVLEAYYQYLKEKKFGWLVRNGITPEMLVKDYRYPPYEAFCIMIRLQDDPSGTLTLLKHKKNEPQYQNKTEPGK